jgi:type I restriction enzyme S subunit
VKFLSGGTPNKGKPEYWNGDIPWVSSAEMTDRHLHTTSLKITQAGLDSGSRLVPAGTIFAVVRGMSLAKEFRISLASRAMAFNQDVKALIPRDGVDGRFLFYALAARADAIRDLATEAAHGTKKLEMDRLESVQIALPPLDQQRLVGDAAFCYDDLIATNQRRIALLEEAARLLYREWFVQLRFPGHESLALQDGLPEGWSRATLGELCDEVPGASVQTGPFGSQLHQHDYKAEGVPVVMPQDIVGDRIRHDRIAFVDEATAARLDRHALQPLDIVFPRRGDIAKRALVEAHQAGYLCGTGCLKISLPLAPLHPVVLYFQLADPTMVKWIEGQAVGATMLNLSATILKSVSCLVPSADAQARFVEIVSDIRRQIDFIERSITETTRARDLLLPKLMSGQLDVSRIPLPEEIAA